MKNLFSFLTIALFIGVFILPSCEEVPVVINSPENPVDPIDPTLENQLQNVLIEEFTGVRCVNCPAGSKLIEQLLGIHGDRLVTVALHGGQFADPYPSSREDLKTVEGERLINELLGEPQGYPGAVINRKLHPGKFSLDLPTGDWAGVINDEKEMLPKAAIIVNPEFNSTTRELKVDVQILPKENLSASDVRLTVLVTESGVIDSQITPDEDLFPPDGIDEDYEHNHILRKIITPFNGLLISSELTVNQILNKEFSLVLPDHWVASNMEVVGIVHQSGSGKEVLQAVKKSIDN